MKFPIRPSSVLRTPAMLAVAAACLVSSETLRAQSSEEYELTNGRRFPAESVKPTPTGFTATIVVGTAQQVFNFTAKDVVRVRLREPKELIEARLLIANFKPDQAISALAPAEAALLPYRGLPESWYARSLILRMDALSEAGKAKEAAAVASADTLAAMNPESASLVRDFQNIVNPTGKDTAEKIELLRALSERIIDPWVSARVWLEIGNTLANQGSIEQAVKAWLRVPVFFPAEKDLSIRGTILAARGLQQLNRAQDGKKLLDDYLADHLASPYKDTIQTELAKLAPKAKKDGSPAPAEATPAADAAPATSNP